jgi:hypothetical protein
MRTSSSLCFSEIGEGRLDQLFNRLSSFNHVGRTPRLIRELNPGIDVHDMQDRCQQVLWCDGRGLGDVNLFGRFTDHLPQFQKLGFTMGVCTAGWC